MPWLLRVRRQEGFAAALLERLVLLRGYNAAAGSWNRKNEEASASLDNAVDELERSGIVVESSTYALLLRRCGNARELAHGKRIHAHIARSGRDRDTFLANVVADMYCKCGSLDDVRAIFDKLPYKNVFSWTVLICANAQQGHGWEAIHLFRRMQLEGVRPDRFTISSIVCACSSVGALAEGKQLHARIARDGGLSADVVIRTDLVNMYSKCGSIGDARDVFDEMLQRDVVAWTAIIAAYTQHGHPLQALELFRQMEAEGVKPNKVTFVSIIDACSISQALAHGRVIQSRVVAGGFELDIFVSNALIHMYSECGSLQEARAVFDRMAGRNVVSWNVMIGAYAQRNHGREALCLFQQMQQQGDRPDDITFLNALDACAVLPALGQGRVIHRSVVSSGYESDVAVGNTLVNMYGKCANLVEARRMFDRMQQRNAISWNVLIAAYAQNGHTQDALELFQLMDLEGVKPEASTFINLLSACSHAGLMYQGLGYFMAMSRDYFLTPRVDHYGCVIDILGRGGWVEEAESLMKSMPLQPNDVMWLTLLGASRLHGDVNRGARAAERVIQMNPHKSSSYVLLSNIYAGAQRREDAGEDGLAGEKKAAACIDKRITCRPGLRFAQRGSVVSSSLLE